MNNPVRCAASASERFPLAIVEPLERRALLAASLVADAVGLYPAQALRVGEVSYFTANDGVHGRELWKSDGTAAGTVMVKDITRGGGSSRVRGMIELDGHLLVFIRGADDTLALWRSDGTAAGTTKVTDFPAGTWVSPPGAVNGRAVFAITPPEGHQVNLWSTDGTAAGTQMVKHLYTNDLLTNPFRAEFIPAGERLLYRDGSSRMYSTDGTTAGTFDLSAAIDDSSPWMILGVTRFKGETYFTTTRGGDRFQLWKTDGTAAGSTRLLNVIGGSNSLIVPSGDYFYFIRLRSQNELWRSDGTAAGTLMLTTTSAQGGFSLIGALPGSGLLFGVRAPSTPASLWRTDGTPESTVQLAQLDPDEGIGQSYVGLAATHFFDVWGENGRCALWRSDGTADNTGFVQEIAASGATPLDTWIEAADGKLVVVRTAGTLILDPETMTAPIGPVQGTMKLTDGVLRVLGTSGDDAIRMYRLAADPNRLVVNLNGTKRSFALAAVQKILVHGFSGNDSVATSEVNGLVAVRTVVWGGPGDDTICTGAGSDAMWGEDGDDYLSASRGHDVASGGNGADTLRGNTGDDTLAGNSGKDRLFGDTGRDLLAGGIGADRIDGGIGVDVLFGQLVFDVFFRGGIDGNPVDDEVLGE